jgi:hypothetical protein
MTLARPLVHPRLMEHVEVTLCPSVATIQRYTVTGRDEYGDPQHEWEDLEDHVDLPCMKAAVTGAGISTGATSGEVRAETGVYDVDARTVVIPRYLPDITDAHRAVIDGETWDIVDVAHDSQSAMTRLRVRAVSEVTVVDGGS